MIIFQSSLGRILFSNEPDKLITGILNKITAVFSSSHGEDLYSMAHESSLPKGADLSKNKHRLELPVANLALFAARTS